LLKELLVAPLVSAGLRLRVRLPGAVNGSFPQLGATCSGSRYVINRPQILLDLMTDLLAGVGTQVLRVQGTEGAALALEICHVTILSKELDNTCRNWGGEFANFLIQNNSESLRKE
jgi:hypothetical protein